MNTPIQRVALEILPTELHREIFKYLTPVAWDCLGVTRKQFYVIYRELHGIVPLTEDGVIIIKRYMFLGRKPKRQEGCPVQLH